ncbi:response regulator [Nitrosopumilus adriaticus]|uniref:Response regulator receiver protein n=1 Tax=Nitrosopumilus adriaticus TaxID=1580092 RepID=A0A0D5C447_9ARCH|nr:response regulator [Nitrosopumilus adriaticus]AJW71476.1 Response regulator receiver protein [Nitrosopumilus adriaticus]
MGITAIIAEDDLINLKLFAELLEINGISVVGKVTNGKEAVTSFEESNPDVVFLDVMMPEFDGIYALEQIRKKNPSSKVVMVTADTSEETEQLLEKLKPSAVIHKPYEIITILHILENQLELKISSSD